MSVCPFMSKGPNVDDWCGCITTCELRINNGCALKILAQKAILDAKKKRQQTFWRASRVLQIAPVNFTSSSTVCSFLASSENICMCSQRRFLSSALVKFRFSIILTSFLFVDAFYSDCRI